MYPRWTGGRNYISWSFAILPFIEQPAVYELGNRVVPITATTPPLAAYGGPDAFMAQSPKIFRCPSDNVTNLTPILSGMYYYGMTTYGASSATATGWYSGFVTGVPEKFDGLCTFNSMIPLSNVPDGTSNTLLVGERTYNDPGLASYGYTPESIFYYHGSLFRAGNAPPLGVIRVPLDQINFRVPLGLTGTAQSSAFTKRNLNYSSDHPGGANFAFGDGSVRFLRESLSLITLQALVTREGGEVVTTD